jgi:hypothetical protein
VPGRIPAAVEGCHFTFHDADHALGLGDIQYARLRQPVYLQASLIQQPSGGHFGLEQATQSGERTAQELEQEREREAEAGKDERLSVLTVENARLDERVKAAEACGSELKEQTQALPGGLHGGVQGPEEQAAPPRKDRSSGGGTIYTASVITPDTE